MTTPYVLFAQDWLTVFEQGCVDLKYIVILIRDEIRDDQIKSAAGRKSNLRPGQEICHGWHIQLKSDGKSQRSFLFWLIVWLAADTGEHLAVDVGLLIYGHIVHPALIDQLQEPLLETVACIIENLGQALAC